MGFSGLFFLVFTLSERYTRRQRHGEKEQIEQFRVFGNTQLDYSVLNVRPGNMLVAIRDPRNLYYLRNVLQKTDTTKQDVVVMTVRLYHREHSFSGSTVFEAKDVFDHYEQELFTQCGQRGGEAGQTGVPAGGARERSSSTPS